MVTHRDSGRSAQLQAQVGQAPAERDHLHRRHGCVESLVARFDASALDGLLQCVGSENAEADRNARSQRNRRHPLGDFRRDVVEVRRATAHHRTDSYDGIVFVALGEPGTDHRDFPGAGHTHDAHIAPLCPVPQQCVDGALNQAVDFLLDHDLAAGDYPTATEVSSYWHQFGFPLGYTSDMLEALEVLLQAGVPADHPRLQAALSLVLHKQDEQGRWALEHPLSKTWTSFGPKNKPSKWVTLRALRVLKQTP